MLIGSLIHELFQAVISRQLITEAQIRTVLNRMITSQDMLMRLYETNMLMDELRTELMKFVPKIAIFVSRYLTGKDASTVPTDEFKGRIDNIVDIEECIWVPQLGLKGKVDVTVQTRRADNMASSKNYEIKTSFIYN